MCSTKPVMNALSVPQFISQRHSLKIGYASISRPVFPQNLFPEHLKHVLRGNFYLISNWSFFVNICYYLTN